MNDTALSENELAKAAGGKVCVDVVLSVVPLIGTIVCGAELIASAAYKDCHVNLTDESKGFCEED